MELKQELMQTNWKNSETIFRNENEFECRKWLKYHFSWFFQITVKKFAVNQRQFQITWDARKPFGWFEMQENTDKITIENSYKHRQ
jgi:hypothetical protein